MWSTSLALATLPKVNSIRITEYNPLRLERIKWMHERGDQLLEDMHTEGVLEVYQTLKQDFKAADIPIVSPRRFDNIAQELADQAVREEYGKESVDDADEKAGLIVRQRIAEKNIMVMHPKAKMLMTALGDLVFV